MEKRNSQRMDRGGELSEVVQAMLDALMNHANSGVAVYRADNEGKDFIFVDFNRAAEDIEGVNKDQIIGRNVLDVFPGVKTFGLLDVFQRVWKTGRPEEHPVSVYKDERITGWRQNYVCKLPNGHIMAVYSDATQSKRSELATRMSEQCFRAIANYTYDWEVWVGPEGRALWTNPAVSRVTGYSIKELISLPDYPGRLIHAEDGDRMRRAFQSALGGSTGNNVEFRLERKDGRIVWVEVSWQPIYDENGNSLGHRESFRDITIRKSAQEALAKAEREKQTILDSLAEHVVYQDRDMTVLWANRAACESLGLTREQAIGRHCYELWCKQGEACPDCPVMKAMESGSRAEVEKATPDGRTWFIQGSPVQNERGDVVGGVEITMEITDYKRIEQELQELRADYRRLQARDESAQ